MLEVHAYVIVSGMHLGLLGMNWQRKQNIYSGPTRIKDGSWLFHRQAQNLPTAFQKGEIDHDNSHNSYFDKFLLISTLERSRVSKLKIGV